MARTPLPPGPPPPNFRPPGSPRPSGLPTPGIPLGGRPAPATTPGSSGIGPAAATAVAVVTLLLGLVLGFFLGRTYGESDATSAAAPLTTATPAPTSRPPGDTIPQTPVAPGSGSTPGTIPASPPSTDLAPATIGALDDPVPVGQAYVLGLYEIEVRDALLDAAGVLADFDAANPAPPPGQQHVLVEVAVRFTDASGFGDPGSIPFFVADDTGRWYAFDASCGRVPGDLAATGFIELGEEAVGQVCFTVPTDAADSLRFGTEGFAGPLYFALPG